MSESNEFNDGPVEPETVPTQATIEADRRDAAAPHDADEIRPGTDDVDQELDPEVAEHYRDAIERGANVRGEGQITP